MTEKNPFKILLKSRKFWLAMLDAFIGSLSLVLAWFLAPEKVASIMTLFGLWQPVIIILIGSIAAEDIALSKADADMYRAEQDVIIAKAYQDKPLPPLATASGEPVGLAIPCEGNTK